MVATALALTVLTGFTGLVYEVTWQKCLAALLGSHSEATAAVLGIFLGGLSLGYALFGRITAALTARAAAAGRPPHLLRFYGLVEGAIGVLALLFPLLFQLAMELSLALPETTPGLAFALDVGLTALLIGPPTVLMGGTIPVLTQALARSLDDVTRVHAYIYAFNTVGAFAGALAAGFVLIPTLGIEGVLRTMGLVNLAAGVAFVLLGGTARGRSAVAPDAAEGSASRLAAGYGLVAVLLGFGMMATQTVLIRIGGLSLGASHFTFAMVVAVFVLCIALGSLAVSLVPRVPRFALPGAAWGLVLLLLALYPQIENAPFWAHVLRMEFAREGAYHAFHLSAFLALLALLAVPVGLAGATLPLLFHHLRHQLTGVGAVAGRLYSWNTVGNLLGALLGGYLLLFWLDLHEVYRLALAALALAALWLTARVFAWPRALAPVLAVAAVAGLAFLPPWDPYRLSSGLFRAREPKPLVERGPDLFFQARSHSLDFYRDGPTASVTVFGGFQHRGRPQRAIVVNGKPDSSTGEDYETLVLLGLLPCLMADRCERAFVVGYGTGVTVGELAALEGMERVEVAEIAHGVIEAAPLFDFANHQTSRNERVELIRSDAYRALMRAEGHFDVIVSEPSNPWVTGVEMLYSREFLQAAAGRLAPGGVYAQWLHTYETDDETLALILRTLLEVFDHASVWFTTGPDVLILGFDRREPALDLARLERRVARDDFAAGLRRARIESVPALLAHELLPLGALRALALEGRVHTLLEPRLSHQAAQAFYRGDRASLPGTARGRAAEVARSNALLRRYLAGRGEALTDRDRFQVVDQICRSRSDECIAAMAWWQVASPEGELLHRFLARVAEKPAFQKLQREGTLRRVRSLYARSQWQAPVTYADAVHATELYEQLFLPGLPFDADALWSLWSRCRDEAGRCESGRRRAEERLVGPRTQTAATRP